jgi:adenine C2-methylase RlmN of 23S rRNA A2503 and tRNA A37
VPGFAVFAIDHAFQRGGYEPPPRETVGVLLDELHARGIVAHFRRPRGATIDGAGGQFRALASG